MWKIKQYEKKIGAVAMRRIFLTSMFVISSAFAFGAVKESEMFIVEKSVCRVPIIVGKNAPPATLQAAGELAHYMKLISGAAPEIIKGDSDSKNLPKHGIWVGIQPELTSLFPDLNFKFINPEEILIACNGQDLVIAGRDVINGGKQTECGTANAVYTFLQKYLGVRWFWPGPEGEDIIQNDTVKFSPFVYRFHPPFVQRRMRRPPCKKEAAAQTEIWFRLQRLSLYSFNYSGGHAFTEWWDKYHKEHPEYFALQPDGTRDNICGADVKICPSNPGMQKQWLDNAEEMLRKDPSLVCVSASPNDGSTTGECVCAECRVWDNPNGAIYQLYGKGGPYKSVALTDRYVKFWNILARRLKERFPDREVYVGAYAYGPYTNPPVSEVLDKNVVIGYVGSFPICSDEYSKKMKGDWGKWAGNAAKMVYRPNLFHYSGGWLGLPTVSMRKTIDDFRFLAENKCIGLNVDSLPMSWATQGIQFYIMGQLAYDPLQDGNALLKDYYARAFGNAAENMEEYFNIMEKAHEAILEKIQLSGGFAKDAIAVFRATYTDEILNRADTALKAAEAKFKADSNTLCKKRVDFIRSGYEFTKLQVEIMQTMALVRESKGKDAAAVRKAIELCAFRNDFYENRKANVFAVQAQEWYHSKRALDDYMGPPSKVFRAAAGVQ
jgi:hypothetical protein